MRHLIAIAMLLAVAAIGANAQTTKCYENSGLKDSHMITFQITGTQVEGEFRIDRDFDSAKQEVHAFSGTLSGQTVSVVFPKIVPDSLPKSPRTKTWTMSTSGLKVTLYGRNYETNNWSNYTAVYRSCTPPIDALRKTASRVNFSKGSTSAEVATTFTAQGQQRAFLLNLRAKQRITVFAPGCGISFLYPNGKRYEEGTEIDSWGTASLPQNGDYLFIISPAGEPGTCSVKFDVR